jgi:hypothetical protein
MRVSGAAFFRQSLAVSRPRRSVTSHNAPQHPRPVVRRRKRAASKNRRGRARPGPGRWNWEPQRERVGRGGGQGRAARSGGPSADVCSQRAGCRAVQAAKPLRLSVVLAPTRTQEGGQAVRGRPCASSGIASGGIGPSPRDRSDVLGRCGASGDDHGAPGRWPRGRSLSRPVATQAGPRCGGRRR